MTFQATNHTAELDKAVALAQRAATIGRLQEPQRLTRFLYKHWYLGKAVLTTRPAVPQQRTGPLGVAGRPQPWRSWGTAWTEDRSARGSDLVRLHLSCAPHTSLHAFGLVTSRAQDWEHPWLLTSRAVNQAVPDPDATVLYLPADALDDLRRPLARLLEDLQPFLATGVPALTLRVARGATLAQNPADGRSYGEHRCTLIATTVLGHLHQPHRQLLARTSESFEEAGVDPQRPYRARDARWEWKGLSAAA